MKNFIRSCIVTILVGVTSVTQAQIIIPNSTSMQENIQSDEPTGICPMFYAPAQCIGIYGRITFEGKGSNQCYAEYDLWQNILAGNSIDGAQYRWFARPKWSEVSVTCEPVVENFDE